MKNLFDQEPWGRRGESVDRIASLQTRLANAEALLRSSGTTVVAVSGSGGHANFVDWYGGTAEVSLTKLRADTRLQITYWTSFYVDVPLGITFAMKNMATGADHAVGLNHFSNTAWAHESFGGVITPSDTAIGAYTYRFRQRVAVNAGTTFVDNNNAVQLLIREVLL